MKKSLTILCLIALAVAFPVASPAQQQKQKLLIGLIPEINIFKQKQRYKILGDYLSKKTGYDVRFTVLSRYGNIIESFAKDKMDGAFFGSFTGALAISRLGVIPIARPVNLDNTDSYQGYIFVKKSSGIKNVSGMKGKKMAYVDKATTAGYLFPLAYLRESGVTDMNGFFKESFFAGSHDAAVNAVLEGKADVGAAKHSIYEKMSKESPKISQELEIIAKSPWVPSNGLCLKKDISTAILKKLQDALLQMDSNADGRESLGKFGALKFVNTTAADYRKVSDLAAAAGIDLKKYDYRNE